MKRKGIIMGKIKIGMPMMQATPLMKKIKTQKMFYSWP
jgi:hypothetical protein